MGAVLYEVCEGVATLTLNRPESLKTFDASLNPSLIEAPPFGGH